MAFFKKINRGLLILIALVLIVAGYLIMLHFIRLQNQSQLKEVLTDYLSVYEQDVVLGQQKAEDALQAARTNEADFFASEESFKTTLAVLEEIFDGQEQSGTIEEYEVRIRKFDSFTFDGKTAKVTLSANVSYKGPNGIMPGLSSNSSLTNTTAEFVLEKGKDGWKIFYFSGYMINQYNAETYTKTVIE